MTLVDWGNDTTEIGNLAEPIIEEFQLIRDNEVTEVDKNDEFFVDGGETTFFSELFDESSL